MTSARLIFLPLIAALVLVAAGCGKSSKPETATEWANSFCSSVTTWKESITSAVSPLKSGNITKDSVNTAFNDFKSATDTFVKSVKDLGKPPTQAGDQAKSDIDQLTTQIDNSVKSIQNDVGNVSSVSSALAVVPSVTATLYVDADRCDDDVQQPEADRRERQVDERVRKRELLQVAGELGVVRLEPRLGPGSGRRQLWEPTGYPGRFDHPVGRGVQCRSNQPRRRFSICSPR